MAIDTILPDIKPGKSTGISCKQESPIIVIPLVEDEICPCFFNVCDYKETAFIYLEDVNDEYRNDKFSVLEELATDTSLYMIYLIAPDGSEIEITSEDYGQMFEPGFNSEQPLQFGYVFEWHKVFNQVLQYGDYQVKIEIDNLGRISSKTSRIFNVCNFSELVALDTVRIETISTGCILNEKDYTGISWPQQTRIKAQFNFSGIVEENIFYENSQFSQQQNQKRKDFEYTLELGYMPYNPSEELIRREFMATQIFITDYNTTNYKNYNKIEVSQESMEIKPYSTRDNRRAFKIVFKDIKPIIKRP